MYKIERTHLTAPGWNIPADAILTPSGNIYWEEDDTMWAVNPETGASCHCGKGDGCVWTDWEGGVDEYENITARYV